MKLRKHVLPHVQAMLEMESSTLQEHSSPGMTGNNVEAINVVHSDLSGFVFLENDQIYHHKLT